MKYITCPERFLDAETIKRVEQIAEFHSKDSNGTFARTYAIGDIHGMAEYLLKLLEFITDSQRVSNIFPSRFVFLGDYVDRGPEVAQVLAIVRLLQEIMPKGSVIVLTGNHEQMLLEEIREHGELTWDRATGLSFQKLGLSRVPPWDLVDWLMDLPVYFEDAKHYYVHAGFRPGKLIKEQSKETMIWIRDEFLSSKYNFGKQVFHGHTPRPFLDQNEYRTNVDTGSCFGGYLTAAEIVDNKRFPIGFFQVRGDEALQYSLIENKYQIITKELVD